MQARKHIFPLTPESKRKGWLPLSDPVWMEWGCPWWIFSSDRPTKGEAQVFGWRALSPQSLDQSLKDLELEEEDVVKKICLSKTRVVSCWGNVISKNLILAKATMGGSSLLISSREAQMGILEHMVFLAQGVKYSRRVLRGLGWRLLSKMEAQNLHEGAQFRPNSIPMNILLWNCKGALNPRFHVTLKNLINTHTPTIVIIMET